MDLLFKRYASPFLLNDQLILTNSLDKFIDDLFKFMGEEKQEQTKWEFFLHKIYDKSWKEFCNEIEVSNVENNVENDVDIAETLNNSKNILNNFTPM